VEPPAAPPLPVAAAQPPPASPPAGPPTTEGPGGRRAALVVVGAAVAAVVVAGGVWFGLRQASSSTAHSTAGTTPAAGASMQPSTTPPTNPLRQAIVVANRATGGLVPPQTCQFHGDTNATCDHPAFAVNTVSLATFGSLDTLYTQYVHRVKAITGGSYRQNVGGCSTRSTSGESSWNHNYQHPRGYSLAQVRAGTLTDDQASGRLFCTVDNGELHVVWTDNHGVLLAEMTGFPHVDAYKWWRHVHHNLEVVPMSGMSGSAAR